MTIEKPKIAGFGLAYWEDKPQKTYPEWKKRILKYSGCDSFFLAPGSYCDPEKLGDPDFPVVQIGLKLTKDYSRDWSYAHVGMMAGFYHLLLNIKDFDVAVHVQNTVFLGMDLAPVIEEFMERDEIFASPKFTSEMGCYIETGLMLLKKEAVIKYVTSPTRPSLSEEKTMNVEQEAFTLFHDSWWNFLPEIPTLRKTDTTVYENGGGPFSLSEEDFLNLPVVLTSHYVTLDELQKWSEVHPI